MFSDRLEEALKNKKISGSKLCTILNVNNRNYTNWKRNEIPRGETLKQIADILEVSVDWLLERENAMNPKENNLLKNYRAANAKGKRIIENIAEQEAQEQQSLTSGNGYIEKNEA